MSIVPAHIVDAFNGNEKAAELALYQQASIWMTGHDATEQIKGTVSMKDAMALQNASVLIPHVLTRYVLEGIEPMLVGTRLLTRIPYKPGLTIQFPAMGALFAQDVAPGQSLPEYAPDMSGQTSTEMRISRSGLALKIFDDIIKYDSYNLVGHWLRLAGNALARHKETKIFNFINSVGTVAFDNVNPANGLLGKYTTGRNQNGGLNAGITMDDILEMYVLGLQQGFHLDTIMVHPLTWLMFLRDPVLRQFQLQYGGGSWWNGQVWGAQTIGSNPLAQFPPLGEGTGQLINPPGSAAATPTEQYDQNLRHVPTLPPYLGLQFKLIPSQFVPFDPVKNTASVIMFNSQNLGALIVDEDPKVQEFKNPEFDLTKMQISEKYAIAIMQEGQAVITAKNVKIARNYMADDTVRPTLLVNGQFSGIGFDPTIPISGNPSLVG